MSPEITNTNLGCLFPSFLLDPNVWFGMLITKVKFEHLISFGKRENSCRLILLVVSIQQ
jgi:hypothetical protein